jgi:glycosyltransferase involved in cell wall biosynthesis
MTLISPLIFNLPQVARLKSPLTFETSSVSVVIPVKDNQEGIDLLLSEFFRTHSATQYPREIIIVDNRSSHKISVREEFRLHGVPIILLGCERPGPASARNVGYKKSCGEWILFLDSDCVPSASLLAGYKEAMSGAVGYAGYVKSWGQDLISKYYESQEILLPFRCLAEDGRYAPQYLITANTLIWRKALDYIGGFNEQFQIASGEDIDVGLRLSQVGCLSYAPHSLVFHNYSDGLIGFFKRFVRYGRGNAKISSIYKTDLRPIRVVPMRPSDFNTIMAKLQYWLLLLGYFEEVMLLKLTHKKFKLD